MDTATIATIIATGIGVIMATYTFLRNFKTDIKSEISDMKTQLNGKIDKLDEKVTDIDRHLCRLEGAFSA